MLIGFIGAPASGTTTVAAMLFGRIKSKDRVAELITETARRYIIEKRWRGEFGSKLTDADQDEIFSRQAEAEALYTHVLPKSDIIITDGCILNNYLCRDQPPDHREDDFRAVLSQYDLIFYCPRSPSQYVESDMGRIHDRHEADAIDHRIPDIMARFGVKYTELTGTPEVRLNTAWNTVMSFLMYYFPEADF